MDLAYQDHHIWQTLSFSHQGFRFCQEFLKSILGRSIDKCCHPSCDFCPSNDHHDALSMVTPVEFSKNSFRSSCTYNISQMEFIHRETGYFHPLFLFGTLPLSRLQILLMRSHPNRRLLLFKRMLWHTRYHCIELQES